MAPAMKEREYLPRAAERAGWVGAGRRTVGNMAPELHPEAQ